MKTKEIVVKVLETLSPMTCRQLAKESGLSKSLCDRLLRDGSIPAHKENRRRFCDWLLKIIDATPETGIEKRIPDVLLAISVGIPPLRKAQERHFGASQIDAGTKTKPTLRHFSAKPSPRLKSAFSKKPRKRGNASGASPEVPSINHDSQEDSMLLRSENLTQAAKRQFGLTRSPFIDEVNTTADVFNSASTRYVRAALLDAALNHGFIAIVGESGAGKTTLAEELEERVASEARPVIVIRPYVLAMEDNDNKGRTLKSGQIAEAIIRTLDPTGSPKRTPEARFRQVHELLKQSRAAGYSHLILIEEAHCLPTPTLKHLKRFLELKQGLSRLLGVCLIGQPELKVRLSEQKADVREVVQRCEIIDLPPLDNDLPAYIAHKFERVGVKASDILATDAADAIRARLIRVPRGGKASEAVSLCFPLVVNNLLARAMNAAAAAGWAKVDAQVIGGI